MGWRDTIKDEPEGAAPEKKASSWRDTIAADPDPDSGVLDALSDLSRSTAAHEPFADLGAKVAARGYAATQKLGDLFRDEGDQHSFDDYVKQGLGTEQAGRDEAAARSPLAWDAGKVAGAASGLAMPVPGAGVAGVAGMGMRVAGGAALGALDHGSQGLDDPSFIDGGKATVGALFGGGAAALRGVIRPAGKAGVDPNWLDQVPGEFGADVAARAPGLISRGFNAVGDAVKSPALQRVVGKTAAGAAGLATGALTHDPFLAIGVGAATKELKAAAGPLLKQGADKIGDILKATPEAFGKFAPTLLEAANRGTQSLAVAHYLLMGQDPDYRKLFNPESEQAVADE